MPMSQKRELEIEQELAAIMRNLIAMRRAKSRDPKSLHKLFSSRGRAAAPSLTSRRTVRA